MEWNSSLRITVQKDLKTCIRGQIKKSTALTLSQLKKIVTHGYEKVTKKLNLKTWQRYQKEKTLNAVHHQKHQPINW